MCRHEEEQLACLQVTVQNELVVELPHPAEHMDTKQLHRLGGNVVERLIRNVLHHSLVVRWLHVKT